MFKRFTPTHQRAILWGGRYELTLALFRGMVNVSKPFHRAYAGCLLASCVMLGVAAEAEFLRLADVAAKGKHAANFAAAATTKPLFIAERIRKFQAALKLLVDGNGEPGYELFDDPISASNCKKRSRSPNCCKPRARTGVCIHAIVRAVRASAYAAAQGARL
jgi:hypothetical protein